MWGLPDVVVSAIELHHDTQQPAEAHEAVVTAVRLAQAAAECLEKGDHQFTGAGLTPEQIEAIADEFALTDMMPESREPLLHGRRHLGVRPAPSGGRPHSAVTAHARGDRSSRSRLRTGRRLPSSSSHLR